MSCHQVEILNYEHSIVELSKGNTLVVTDNNTCNSVTIPQPVTCILQVNSPGPQGPSGTGGGGSGVSYITGSGPLSLTEIEVADFSNDVSVTFVNNRLKFIFGTPLVPSTPTMSFGLGGNTFEQDRFNKQLDAYVITGSFAVNGYTLISASLYTGSVLLAQTGTGTILTSSLTTSGSQVYRLEVTASSPLDGTFVTQSITLSGSLNKTNPTSPNMSGTPLVQLGAYNGNIEQGATGSLSFTATFGTSNGWIPTKLISSSLSPLIITGSLTGSALIQITAAAFYSSSGVNGSNNSPALTTTTSNALYFPKIISLRYGTSDSSSFTQAELEDLALWDTSLGGTIGTIALGTQNPSGQSISITWSGNKYQYIIYDGNLWTNLTAITFLQSNVLDGVTFPTTPTIVGPYKIYRTINKQAGGGGISQTYGLL
jgi:hypothetical protein